MSSPSKRKRSRSRSRSRSSSSSSSSGNSSPTTLAPLFLPANTDPLPNVPKIFVINSHGTCPMNVPKISSLPVKVITCAKLGCAHHRAVLLPVTEELAPHTTVSFKNAFENKYHTNPGSALPVLAIDAINQMADDKITESHPVLHEIHEELEDMELFCNGSTMAEGVHVMYHDPSTRNFVMADASSHFGLTTVRDADRVFFVSSKPPKFPNPLHPTMRRALKAKRNQLESRKVLAYTQPIDVKHRLNLDIDAYNASFRMAKNISAVSRLQPNYQLLSSLLNIGIANGTINTDDCVVIFACRKFKPTHRKPTPGVKKKRQIRIYRKTIRRSNKIKLRNNKSKKK